MKRMAISVPFTVSSGNAVMDGAIIPAADEPARALRCRPQRRVSRVQDGIWTARLPTWLLLIASLLVVWQGPLPWLVVPVSAVTLIVAARLDRGRPEPRQGP